jgi:hypothetical protein
MNETLTQNASFAEDLIANAIHRAYPELLILRNTKPQWLNSKRGNPLELDIYLPEIKLAIEIQGPIHFKKIFKNSDRKRMRLIENDLLKKQLCREKAVRLLWMDYEGIFKDFRGKTLAEKTNIISQIFEAFTLSQKSFMFWRGERKYLFE